MKKIIYSIFIIILFIIIIFLIFNLTGYGMKEDELNEKAYEELKFIDNKLISMINSLNNINFTNYSLVEEDIEMKNKKQNTEDSSNSGSQNSGENQSDSEENNIIVYELKNNSILTTNKNQINWEYLKKDIEIINSKWTNIIIDLHQLNINNDDILSFSSTLDKTVISIKEENNVQSLINLVNLYSYIPKYLNQFSNDKEKISIMYIKSNILNSYALLEENRWDDVKNEIVVSIENLTTMMNSVEIDSSTQNRISKLYVMLNELNNSVSLQDKDLYYMKYKNIMEELMNY